MNRTRVVLVTALMVCAGCAPSVRDRRIEIPVADSSISSGLLLRNLGDTAFVLTQRWHVLDSLSPLPDGSIWVVSPHRLHYQMHFDGYDRTVIRIDSMSLVPLAIGFTRLVVHHADVIDTIGVIVDTVGRHLVATLDSTTLPRPPSYHVSTWDTAGGWSRRRAAAAIVAGMPRSTALKRLGNPTSACLTKADSTLSESWAVTTSTSVVIQSRADRIVRAYIADFKTRSELPIN